MDYDDRIERLTPSLRSTVLIGLFLIPSMEVLATNDLTIAISPGIAVLDGHVANYDGEDDFQCYGSTLAASSEIWATLYAFYNPTVNGVTFAKLAGTAALTSAGATKPTIAQIEAAIEAVVGEDVEYAYAIIGDVKFARDSGSVLTIPKIDNIRRSYGVPEDTKEVAAAYHDVAPITEGALFRPWGTIKHTIDAADISAADILTDHPCPLFYGRVRAVRAVVEKAVTTGAKAADVDLHLGATVITGGGSGGEAEIVLAGAYAKGAIVAGTAITSTHGWFAPGQILSFVARDITAFVEGRISFEADIDALVLPGFGA